jgi:hypothetical protein
MMIATFSMRGNLRQRCLSSFAASSGSKKIWRVYLSGEIMIIFILTINTRLFRHEIFRRYPQFCLCVLPTNIKTQPHHKILGEIHSDWREVIAEGIQKKNLPVHLTSPNTSHEDSDDCGENEI